MLENPFKKAYLNVRNKTSKYIKEMKSISKTLKFISDLVFKKVVAFQNKIIDPKAY